MCIQVFNHIFEESGFSSCLPNDAWWQGASSLSAAECSALYSWLHCLSSGMGKKEVRMSLSITLSTNTSDFLTEDRLVNVMGWLGPVWHACDIECSLIVPRRLVLCAISKELLSFFFLSFTVFWILHWNLFLMQRKGQNSPVAAAEAHDIHQCLQGSASLLPASFFMFFSSCWAKRGHRGCVAHLVIDVKALAAASRCVIMYKAAF